MMAMIIGRPSAVLPYSTSFIRSDSLATVFQYCEQLSVVGQEVIFAYGVLADFGRADRLLSEGRAQGGDGQHRGEAGIGFQGSVRIGVSI